MAEEPERAMKCSDLSPLEPAATFSHRVATEPPHIMDLLGIDRDHVDEGENLDAKVPFQHLRTDTCFTVSFHPETAGVNEFEDEQEEEMIKIVNPNKHIQNYEDGGRRRKLRHVSKIDCFKRGKDAINPFCKDLFGVKQLAPTPQKDESDDFS